MGFSASETTIWAESSWFVKSFGLSDVEISRPKLNDQKSLQETNLLMVLSSRSGKMQTYMYTVCYLGNIGILYKSLLLTFTYVSAVRAPDETRGYGIRSGYSSPQIRRYPVLFKERERERYKNRTREFLRRSSETKTALLSFLCVWHSRGLCLAVIPCLRLHQSGRVNCLCPAAVCRFATFVSNFALCRVGPCLRNLLALL